MSIPVLTGLAALAARYDGFIIDLWGVLHDGSTAFPGAIATLTALSRANKKSLLLSNAPRRVRLLEAQLTAMGITPDLYTALLSSGEAAHLALAARDRPFYAGLGRRFHLMGPADDDSVIVGLDYQRAPIDEADFILAIGPGDDETIADYLPALKRGAARALPMVCVNPDRVVIHHGKSMPCAGALADLYIEMGGRVDWQGKPDSAIYGRALGLLQTSPARTLAIGDALATDIKGAAGAGLDSVLVAGGIHAAALDFDPTGTAPPDAARLDRLLADAEAAPTAILPVLTWD